MTQATAFARFLKRWATGGTTAEPSDNQADAGLAFLGANAPTFGLHNAMFQWLDDKDNWLFRQLSGVLTAAGVTPTATTPDAALFGAARTMFSSTWAAVDNNTTLTAPAWANRVEAMVIGGGAGGGGTGTAGTGGGGGGAGGYAWGVYTVTPGSTLAVTIGAGGAGSASNGSAGGTTSLGPLLSASGGGGGGAYASFPAGGAGGVGVGGSTLLYQGNSGGDGGSFTAVGGNGGSSPYFSSGSGRAGSGAGVPGSAHGAGGGGGYLQPGNAGPATGGAGYKGLVLYRWLP
jgi:hypothetical protein